jgi:hypothetical protein
MSELAIALESSKNLRKGYELLIDLEGRCPPYTDAHLHQLEGEVALARQQVNSLLHHRQDLFVSTVKELSARKKQLLDKSAYYQEAKDIITKKVVLFLNDSLNRRLPIPALSSIGGNASFSSPYGNSAGNHQPSEAIIAAYRISGIIDDNEEESRPADMRNREKNEVIVVNDVMRKFGTAISKKISQFGNLSSPSGADIVIKENAMEEEKAKIDTTAEQSTNNQEVVLDVAQTPTVIATPVSVFTIATDQKVNAATKKTRVLRTAKQQIVYIHEKTGCNNINEFLDRFKNNLKVTEILKSHQILADSKLAQLRAEYSDLYGTLGDGIVNVSTPSAPHPNASQTTSRRRSSVNLVKQDSLKEKAQILLDSRVHLEEEKDVRYMDQKLLEAEVNVAQSSKRMERTVKLINEVKMGVWHLMSLIDANKSIFTSLPKNPAPNLDVATSNNAMAQDHLVVQGLHWCEERLLAINEVMMLDATKQISTSNQPASATTNPVDQDLTCQPIHQRQTKLATAVMNSISTRVRKEEAKDEASQATETSLQTARKTAPVPTSIPTSMSQAIFGDLIPSSKNKSSLIPTTILVSIDTLGIFCLQYLITVSVIGSFAR